MITPGTSTAQQLPQGGHVDYGAANKFGFNDPSKWHTEPDVPLLDEHEMVSEGGQPEAVVDRAVLEEIARNNNAKVYQTGDPATLILGHTSDDPRAPEKPAKGFVVNYRVKPFRRDPQSGKTIYAIFGDYKVRPKNAHLIESYPRRSVELWWHKKDIDPIAMLGGSSPERDLGAVIRHGRINHVSMAVEPRRDGVRGSTPSSRGEVIHFSRRGNHVIETYSISPARRRYNCDPRMKYAKPPTNDTPEEDDDEEQYSPEDRARMNKPDAANKDREHKNAEQERAKQELDERRGRRKPPPFSNYSAGDHDMPQRYDDTDMRTEDIGDYDGGDDGMPDNDMDAGADGPESEFDAKLGQSKIIKTLQAGIDQILQALGGGGAPGGGMDEPGMDGGMGDEMPPPGAGGGMPPGGGAPPMGAAPGGGGGQPGMFPPGGEEMPPEEDESRRGMGEHPVQMSGTSFPGSGNVNIPTFGGNGKSRSSYSRNGTSMNGTRTQRAPQSGRPVLNSRESALEQKVIRLERQRQEDRLRFARQEATQVIGDLEREGVLFGDTPEVAAQMKAARIEDITSEILFDQDTASTAQPTQYAREHVEEIRRCYRRRAVDPARRPTEPLSKFSRSQVDISGAKVEDEDDDAFETRVANELGNERVVEMADLEVRGMPKLEIRKYMRKKYRI